MQALIVLAITFALLWVLFILPQQRRVRAHQQLVSGLDEGDEVVLTAGIYGRITELGPEELSLEVAPGVEMRVARQAVLRRIQTAEPGPLEPDDLDEADEADKIDGIDEIEPGDALDARNEGPRSVGELPVQRPEATHRAEPE
ncbi:MAG TPA: preprotein translocase subunit YajC [Acidimicrobiales bacterium]|nr:preprotein translocase subunit YajC [Acidimicrobiales bacterium]